ncbi:MAG: TetR/AcrR family transcriptional regulator [Pseudomonadota bacterium]
MKNATRAGYHHGALREALLDQAITLLDAEGVEAVTIRAVARATGVSHAAPVNHFESRNALLTAMATGFFNDLAHEVARRLRPDAGGRDRVRAFAEALFAYGLGHPHRYRLLWRRDLLIEDEALRTSMDGIYDRLIVELEALPLPGGKSPHTVATALWSLTHGYLVMRMDDVFEARDDEITSQTRLEAMLDLILGPRP